MAVAAQSIFSTTTSQKRQFFLQQLSKKAIFLAEKSKESLSKIPCSRPPPEALKCRRGYTKACCVGKVPCKSPKKNTRCAQIRSEKYILHYTLCFGVNCPYNLASPKKWASPTKSGPRSCCRAIWRARLARRGKEFGYHTLTRFFILGKPIFL